MTYPAPSEETLFILHLDSFFLLLWQLLKEVLALGYHISDQPLRQACIAEVQESDIQQRRAQVVEKFGFGGRVECLREGKDGYGGEGGGWGRRHDEDQFANEDERADAQGGYSERDAAEARLGLLVV